MFGSNPLENGLEKIPATSLILSCLINFPSFQSDLETEVNCVNRSQVEYPAKKLEKYFTYFGNVFSIYLTTKNMALHMHFRW